ncbi:hypothetical protein F5Y16DRAFT_134468 [Xylariaceae sp. FL0255]|nr:hypothetical protein F5Y16DRAFT_134468 [Xylariaceae sp. FL0255]
MINPKAILLRSSAASSSVSASSTSTLSSGAIAGIAVAGSIVVFLAIGSILIVLARWQNQQRAPAMACPISGIPSDASNECEEDGGGPRKLRKVNKAAMNEAAKEVSRHLSFPLLPPVLSRPGSFSFNWGLGGSGTSLPALNESRVKKKGATLFRRPQTPMAATVVAVATGAPSSSRSPEKQRGYQIYQNRRKASWIDEDALHGPRTSSSSSSPRKQHKRSRKGSWLAGRSGGITRALSRHLSIGRNRHRGEQQLELDRSPTLPYTEPFTQPLGLSYGQQYRLQLHQQYQQQQYQEQQARVLPAELSMLANAHIRIVSPTGPQPVALPRPYSQKSAAAAASHQQKSQPPPLTVSRLRAANERQQSPPRLRISSVTVDADLQTILQRTAERLEDGHRSARRQTLALKGCSASQRRSEAVEKQEKCGCGKEHDQFGITGKSGSTPTRQRSWTYNKSTTTVFAELEGCSPIISCTQSPSQGQVQGHHSGASYGHKRTHTRQISHVSHISEISQYSFISSEPDSMAVSVSRTGSQTDVIKTALSSPSRSNHSSPGSATRSMTTTTLMAQSYSPASSQSSGLSTVYSEEEGGESDMGVGGKAGALNQSRAPPRHVTSKILHTRQGTLGHVPATDSRVVVVSSGSPQRPIPSKFTVQGLKTSVEEDPFTACATPSRPTPERLSQVFSPLPAELPGEAAAKANHPSVRITGPGSGSPTPIRSRSPTQRRSTTRRVMPPPYRLRPAASSPTLGQPENGVLGQQLQLQFHLPVPNDQSPPREPSPAVSESGLSSVYDSYRYS